VDASVSLPAGLTIATISARRELDKRGLQAAARTSPSRANMAERPA
jgi:hypothetical protein